MEVGTNNSSETHSSKLKTFLIEGGIILVLVVVALVELQYFKIVDLRTFFPGKSPLQSQQASQEIIPAQINKSNSTFGVRTQALQALQQNVDLIAKNGALHFAFYLIEFEGKIVSIDTTGGIDKDSNLLYKVRLVINVGKGKDTTTVVYPQKFVSKVKIFDTDHNVLGFSDLRPGDRVIIRTTSKIFSLYPNNLYESLITKLK